MQAAKTYLERKFEEFPSCDVDALLQHGLKVSTSYPICVISLRCVMDLYQTFRVKFLKNDAFAPL